MIDPKLLAADAELCRPKPTDAQLSSVALMAIEQRRLEHKVETLEKDVADTKAQLLAARLRLAEEMATIHMAEFKLDDGSQVTVSTEYYANIPAPDSKKAELLARRLAAFQWLRDNKHEALIKTDITVQAGRGEQAKAAMVIRALQELGVQYSSTDGVHWATLRAFVKEQLEKGTPIPEDIFGVHVQKVSTITG